jgi:hypothetical protein
VAEEKNQLVKYVRELDNYLACSLSTRSELVVLIREEGRIVGQFDIDSAERAAFTQENEALLEELASLISPRVASLAARGKPGYPTSTKSRSRASLISGGRAAGLRFSLST